MQCYAMLMVSNANAKQCSFLSMLSLNHVEDYNVHYAMNKILKWVIRGEGGGGD